MTKPVRVHIVIPSASERHGWIAPRLAMFLCKVGSTPGYDVSINLGIDNKSYDFARNVLVDNFLETDAEWLLFIDNDVAPPDDLLHILDNVRPDMYVVSGWYFMFDPHRGFIPLAGYFTGGPAHEWKPIEDTTSGYRRVQLVGGGCLFLRRRLVEQHMKRPWFRCEYDRESRKFTGGDDVLFCKDMLKKGIPIWLDAKYLCKHYHTVDFEAVVELELKKLQKVVDAVRQGEEK